jgi:hypothetical protein
MDNVKRWCTRIPSGRGSAFIARCHPKHCQRRCLRRLMNSCACVGQAAVCAASFDLHAKSPRRYTTTPISCAIPDLSPRRFYDAGYRAARLCAEKLVERNTYTWRGVPCDDRPASGYNTQRDVSAPSAEGCQNGGARTLADYSIFQMQPWLDVRQAVCSRCDCRVQGASGRVRSTLATESRRCGPHGSRAPSIEDIIRTARHMLAANRCCWLTSPIPPRRGSWR